MKTMGIKFLEKYGFFDAMSPQYDFFPTEIPCYRSRANGHYD